MPNPIQTAAVIDIGSNAISLKIEQASNGTRSVLEDLRYPLSLGSDTFSAGKIEPQTVNKLCGVLTNYLKVAAEYDIKNVRAIATTALREASNADYITDIIESRTGLSVEVLHDADEKSYVYREVMHLFEEHGLNVTDCLMAYIGIGNLGIAIYENGRFPFMHSLRLGSLRLSELFENVLDYGESYFDVVDEYQHSVIDDLRTLMPATSAKKPAHFIACGSEALFISSICGARQNGSLMHIAKTSFLERLARVKGKTADALMEEYNITERTAELLFPFMSMCKTLLSLTKADEIIMPIIYLRDAVLYEELFPEKAALQRDKFNENILASAESIASRYRADLKHARLVSHFAKKLFDVLKAQNGFTKKDGLLLNAAAIMHDAGKFINIKRHDFHAYTIISGSDIAGLNPPETEAVALICLFNGNPPENGGEAPPASFKRLSTREQVLILKLAAILGVAEALDRSHKGKFTDIDVSVCGGEITITAKTYKDILLEEWAFKKRTDMFESIFGMKAVIKRKRARQ